MKKLKTALSILILLIFIGLLLTACKNEDSNVFTITVPTQVENENISSDFFSFSSFIKLEISDKSTLGSIAKLKLYNDKIYILDSGTTKGVFVFDINGKFLNKIGDKGKGPGEYQNPQDFYIDEDTKSIAILNSYPKALFFYDLTGNFLKKDEMPFNCSSIDKFGDNFLLRATVCAGTLIKDKRYMFYIWDGTKIVNQFLEIPKDVMFSYSYSCPQSRYNNTISYTDFYNDTIYRFVDGKLSSKLCVDFGDEKIPIDIQKSPMQKKADFMSSQNGTKKYKCAMSNNIETTEFVYFCFSYGGERQNCIYDKINNKTYLFYQLPISGNNFIKSNITSFADNNTVYSVINPDSDIASQFDMKLSDNPGILLLKLKK